MPITIQALNHPKKEEILAWKFKISLVDEPE
jgi:hypothetical protein